MTRITSGIAAISGLLLLGCSDHGPGEPNHLAVEPDYVGAYSVSGNRILMTTAGDTATYCDGGDGAERRVVAVPSESDTLEFRLDGDRLSVLNSPEKDAGDAVVRIGWEADRIGSGSGLDGHWRIRRFDYHLVSGFLDQGLRAAWDARLAAWRRGNALGVSEMEFKDGHAYARSDIRWAEMFVAEWNGDLATEPGAIADSARYKVTASSPDRKTVVLKGETNGETVRIAFDKRGDRYLTSDRDGRAPYRQSREPASCPEGGQAWLAAFLTENSG